MGEQNLPGEQFFNEIIRRPVPIDMNTLTALKRSPLGLDLYLWLTYRTFALRAPLRLTWRLLYSQFGAHQAKSSDKVTVQNFRRKVLRELKKIQTAWPGLEYRIERGRRHEKPGVFGSAAVHAGDPGYHAGWTSPTHKLITRFRTVSGLSGLGWTLIGMP